MASFKIIRNSNQFTSQIFRTLLMSMSGGVGGIIDGLDIDQDSWIASSTDEIKITPGSYIYRGEIIEIQESITIPNIFSSTLNGDVIFFLNHGGDHSRDGVQLGYGRLPYDSNDVVILAHRKGDRFLRRSNVVKNPSYVGVDGASITEDVKNGEITLNITETPYLKVFVEGDPVAQLFLIVGDGTPTPHKVST